MPRHAYDYRCKHCGERFTLQYASYADYDRAEPRCPACGASELSRVISQVAIPKSSRDYRKMSAGEMLSVLESGDQSQVQDMFQQVEGKHPSAKAATLKKPPNPPAE